jgi:MFS family permease
MKNVLSSMRRLNPASGMLMLLSFSAAMFYAFIWFVVPLVIAQQQANAGVMAIGLAIFDLTVVLLGYALGTLADRMDKRALVFFGLLIFSIFGVLLGLNFGWLFIFFGFLATVGDEMAEISLWSWMHHLDKDHTSDGTVSAVISFSEDVGWTLGPVVAGILYTLIGPELSIAFGAIPLFIVWLIYYAFVHRHAFSTVPLVVHPRRPLRRRHKT